LAWQKDIEIRVNPEYEEIMPLLSDEQYNKLKADMELHGQEEPITVNEQGVVLDGHNRLHICRQLKIEPKYKIRYSADKLDEKLYVVRVNLMRIQLTDAQKIRLGKTMEPIYRQKAERNMSLGGKGSSIEEPLHVDRDVARDVGLSETQYYRGKAVLEEDPELFKQKLDTGKETISGTFDEYSKKKRSAEARNKLLNETPKIELPEGIQLSCADFRDFCTQNIPDNSIGLIFTDTLYYKKDLASYKEVATVAARILKVGGSLVVYAAQYALRQIISDAESAGLKYLWPICVKHGGQHRLLFGYGVYVHWKPLLFFIKGNRRPEGAKTFPDFIQSEKPAKDLLEYEQSTVEAEHMIEACTVENEIVLDPFMGSGTTGIAAIKLNRKFIGIEIDKDRFGIAKANIARHLEASK
jgi:site-specific DNA-methyltransferase (adenine-specific)